MKSGSSPKTEIHGENELINRCNPGAFFSAVIHLSKELILRASE